MPCALIEEAASGWEEGEDNMLPWHGFGVLGVRKSVSSTSLLRLYKYPFNEMHRASRHSPNTERGTSNDPDSYLH